MKQNFRAFTLAELLLALAITSILVLLLVSVVSAAMNVWQQGRNQIDTFAGGRELIGRMADEIKGAMAAQDRVEFSENNTSLTGSATSPQSGISENVFFVAPYPNAKDGDLCVLAYRHNRTTHELQRGFVDSDNAFKSSIKYRSAGYNEADFNWRTVATGVVEFEIRCYTQANMDNSSEPTTPWDSMSGATGMVGNVPRRVTLRVRLVDSRNSALLSTLPAGSGPYNALVNRYARNFFADIQLIPPH